MSFLQHLDKHAAIEQIAQIVYELARPEDSLLSWEEAPTGFKEQCRADARYAVRMRDKDIVTNAINHAATMMAQAEYVDTTEFSIMERSRYRFRALAAYNAQKWYIAETAYPENIEHERALDVKRGPSLTMWQAGDMRQRICISGMGGE